MTSGGHPSVTGPGGRPTLYLERHFPWVVLLVLGAFVLWMVPAALGSWRTMTAAEPEWVAEALAAGEGYSFSGQYRWLFEPAPPDQFSPTAWTDPLFTYYYAALLQLFGEHSRLVASLLSLSFVLVTGGLVAATGRRLAGPWAGLVALLALLFTVGDHSIQIYSSPMAGLWIALLLFYFVRNVDRLDLKRSVALGVILALSVLTASSTMIFLPVMMALVILFASATVAAIRNAVAMALTAVLLVSPWTLRNYLVFDEFVPVRTGLGQIAHAGTVALGQTFAPEIMGAVVPAPWTASGPFEAAARVSGLHKPEAGSNPVPWTPSGLIGTLKRLISTRPDHVGVHRWQRQEMRAKYGAEYEGLNEAQRDKLHLQDAKEFMLAHPLVTLQLGVVKEMRFVLSRGKATAALTVVAILVCAVLAFRQRLLIAPLALVAAYAAPFAVIVPYFYRYRYPIDPVIAVLAGVALAYMAQAAWEAARGAPRVPTGPRN